MPLAGADRYMPWHAGVRSALGRHNYHCANRTFPGVIKILVIDYIVSDVVTWFWVFQNRIFLHRISLMNLYHVSQELKYFVDHYLIKFDIR
jgi:hypothetical protein